MLSLKPGNEDPPTPAKKVLPTYRPPDSLPHLVSDGENWATLAARYKVDAKQLIYQNFKADEPKVINWYLREYVKCDTPTPDRYNWRFSTSSRKGGGPRAGTIFITPNWYAIESAARLLTQRWLHDVLGRASLPPVPVSNQMFVKITGRDLQFDQGLHQDFITSLGWQGATDELASLWAKAVSKAIERFVLAVDQVILIPVEAIPKNPFFQADVDLPMYFVLPDWPLLDDGEPGAPPPNFLLDVLPPLGLPVDRGAAAQALTRFCQWWASETGRIKEKTRASGMLGTGTYNHASAAFSGSVQAQTGFLDGFRLTS